MAHRPRWSCVKFPWCSLESPLIFLYYNVNPGLIHCVDSLAGSPSSCMDINPIRSYELQKAMVSGGCSSIFGGFLKWRYPQSIHFKGIFHCKPSNLGYSHLIMETTIWGKDQWPKKHLCQDSGTAIALQVQSTACGRLRTEHRRTMPPLSVEALQKNGIPGGLYNHR